MKRFNCGDVIPGCGRVFTGPGDQSVLDQVLAHAAEEHGLVKPPMALVELVIAHTQPFSPTRDRGHLRVVDAKPRHHLDVADGASAKPQEWALGGRGPADHDPAGGVTPLAGDRTRPGGRGRRADNRVTAAVVHREHETYRHECVMYRGAQEFLAAVAPFIRDGLARDEPVLVAVIEPRLRGLQVALGPDAERVRFVDMAELGHNPARIIPAWREFTAQHSGRPVRGVGEPIWAGRRAAEIVECQFHEALLNMAVPSQTPLWLICPYDAEVLDGAILDQARRSHPVVVEGDAHRVSSRYGGSALVRSMFGAALPDPTTATSAIGFDVRRQDHISRVMDGAQAGGLPTDRAAKLAAAAGEITMAGFRDAGRVRILLWTDPAAVICEIADPGRIDNPMIGRCGVLNPDRRERGIRLANELCDLVQVRSGPEGTTVRLLSWLAA